MPPRDILPSGTISQIMTMTIGAANTIGRFITRLTSLPQKPFSTSSRVWFFCTRAPSQCSHQLVGFQLRKNGTRRKEYTPRESTWRPSSPRQAGSTVIDRIADNVTEAIMAYVSDLRKPCGNSSKAAADATISTDENITVRPAVTTDGGTAASGALPP